MASEHQGLDPVPRVWAVGALIHALSDALAGRFNPVTVRGELSGFIRAGSGHCYFSLKDEQGQLRCALFRRHAVALSFQPQDGDVVEVQARLDVYPTKGDLQLIVETLRPAGGQGQWLTQFFQLKSRLEALGLFSPARKRPLLRHPHAIGIVTSLGAAALHDVISSLRRRVPHIPVQVFPAAVQGAQAAESLCTALGQAASAWTTSGGRLDVLLLVRGGGSLDDLWVFNDERLAHAIAQTPMPVIAGVGHETDFTIADFVADVRAPTPTAAAELCAQPTQELHAELDLAEQRWKRAQQRWLDQQAQRLDACARVLMRPAQRVVHAQQVLQHFNHQLDRILLKKREHEFHKIKAIELFFNKNLVRYQHHLRQQLTQHEQALQALDPRLVLERGYVWLRDADGRTLMHVADIPSGLLVQATLVDGEVALRAI